MTLLEDRQYIEAMMAVEAACRRWKAEHPTARPVFHPLVLPVVGVGRGGLIASVEQALALGVAGNGHARKLLQAMMRPVGGATVRMAEYALEQVYGLPHALTRQGAN